MVNRKEVDLLRKSLIDFLPLPDGYRLDMNESKQLYISRGGKRRYFLSNKLVFSLCGDGDNTSYMKTIVETMTSLDRIAKRLKKDSATRVSIENLLLDIRTKI